MSNSSVVLVRYTDLYKNRTEIGVTFDRAWMCGEDTRYPMGWSNITFLVSGRYDLNSINRVFRESLTAAFSKKGDKVRNVIDALESLTGLVGLFQEVK